MNCTDFEIAVELAVESRTLFADDVLAHAGTCSDCQVVLQRNQALNIAIPAWRSVQLPADFTQHVLANLARTSQNELPSNWNPSEDLVDVEMPSGNDHFPMSPVKSMRPDAERPSLEQSPLHLWPPACSWLSSQHGIREHHCRDQETVSPV